MKKDCYYFAPLITGYIDNELATSIRKEVKVHLDGCPNCYQSYLNEKKLKETVQEKLPTLKAPMYLRRRIRRQLVRNGERPSFLELMQTVFIYRPVAASFALAVMAFLVLFPTYRMMVEGSTHVSSNLTKVENSAKSGELKGEIICLDCEILSHSEGVSKGQYKHDPATHRSGLKSEDGTIWSFVHTNATHELLHNPKYLKKKAQITGTLFKNSRFIFVKGFDLL
ncbi:MAG: zf-HC2 domain-containing protein [bacterium]